MDSLDDVQRFFMLLCPDAAGVKSRMCVLGKKRLPSARRHEVGRQGGRAPGQQQAGFAGRSETVCISSAEAQETGRRWMHPEGATVLPFLFNRTRSLCSASPGTFFASMAAPPCQRFFGFVEATAEDPAELLEGLGPKSYETKTRGEVQGPSLVLLLLLLQAAMHGGHMVAQAAWEVTLVS